MIERERSHFLRNVLLASIDLLTGPLRAFGIDVSRFRSLMHLTLTLDSRGRGGEIGAAEWLPQGVIANLAFTAFGGVLLALFATFTCALNVAVGLLAAGLLTFGSMMTVSLLASALFDRATATLFAGRPIDDRTALAARVAPAVLNVTLIQGAFALPQIVAIGWKYGAWPVVPVAIVVTLFATMLASALVLAIFVVSMRIVSAERFKEALGRIQLGISLLFIAGPQLYPLVPDSQRTALHDIEIGPFASLFPPIWYSDMMAVATGVGLSRWPVTVSLGVAFPVLCLWGAIRASSGKFISAMAAPDVSTSSMRRPAVGIVERLAPRFARNSLERAGYSLCAALQLRDRTSLLQIVPGIVIGVVLTVRFASDFHGSILDGLPFLAYACPLAISQIAIALSRSEFFGAAEIVRVCPVASAQPILVGALKATVVRFVGIPALVILLIVGSTRGVAAAATALVAGISATAISCSALGVFQYSLPFSLPPQKAGTMGGLSLVKFFTLYFGTILILALHRGAAQSPALHLVFAAIAAVIAYNRWIALRNKQVLGAERDDT